MKTQTILLTTVLTLGLAACSTPADKKDEALADYTEEKTKTLQEYKDCVKKSEGIEEKMAQCEALLKAVGAVEGTAIQSSAPAATPTEAPADALSDAPAPAE